MARVLIVEDDANLLASLAAYLAREGHQVARACSAAEAAAAVREQPEVVILDWMLPDGEGIDLLRAWRKSGCEVPVILLTARAELVDKVVGLEVGANDYLTKPFEPRELLARIRVQLRPRSAPPKEPEPLRAGELVVDVARHRVTFRGAPVELTRMEMALLALLVENRARVFTRDELLDKVWGFERYPTTRTVDTHVLQLRQKLAPELIETVRGIGYRFRGET